MVDLSSLGFKQNSKNDIKLKNLREECESVTGKSATDNLFTHVQSNPYSTYKIPEAPYIPENPINQTNEKLGDLQSTIQEESLRNSQSTKKWNRVMLVVSLIALVISAIFSILSYNSSSQSSANLEKLIMEQNSLLKAILAPKNNTIIKPEKLGDIKKETTEKSIGE